MDLVRLHSFSWLQLTASLSSLLLTRRLTSQYIVMGRGRHSDRPTGGVSNARCAYAIGCGFWCCGWVDLRGAVVRPNLDRERRSRHGCWNSQLVSAFRDADESSAGLRLRLHQSLGGAPASAQPRRSASADSTLCAAAA